MKRNYLNTCKVCNKEFSALRPNDCFCSKLCKSKDWGFRNKSKLRAYQLMYTFGITEEQYNFLLEKQNYCCAICGRNQSEFKKRLAVDHDHGTKEIFGLLCMLCNRVLIGRIRTPELYKRAAKYLKKGTGWFIPERRKRKRRRKKIRS